MARYIRPINRQKRDYNRSYSHRESRENCVYLVPTDTSKLIPETIDNFNLKLNKAIKLCNDSFRLEINDHTINTKIIKSVAERHRNTIENLGILVESKTFAPEWRMIIGLGDASVYETSMHLHHVYGFPYIPGSGIKGALRNYFILRYFASENGTVNLENAESRAIKDRGFCDIFGSPEDGYYKKAVKGRIIFFDAYPQGNVIIKRDIMNPHYAPYYSDDENKTPPGDYFNPVPIFFLVVEETKFEFIFGINPEDNQTIPEGKFKGKKPLDVVMENLEDAFENFGIGAKTAVGYGHMVVSK